ncbi:hypothetical protein HKT51_31575, partial [Pseudomonas aeruginosa]|nr:hypothetical protein [Pseudomonas aeruginosa]
LLDMKRYAAALGYKSGGFRAEFSGLMTGLLGGFYLLWLLLRSRRI